MKNKEKYAEQILEIACDGNRIAIIRQTGEFRSCYETPCRECLFHSSNTEQCKEKVREWAELEYIEKPGISKMDRAFLEYIDKRFKSIARNKNGKIYIFTDIAKKNKNLGAFTTNGLYGNVSDCFDIDFPMVKWKDDEPWLIEDLKKLEVVDSYE